MDAKEGSPPHGRGIAASPVICFNLRRITPAWAGNSPALSDELRVR